MILKLSWPWNIEGFVGNNQHRNWALRTTGSQYKSYKTGDICRYLKVSDSTWALLFAPGSVSRLGSWPQQLFVSAGACSDPELLPNCNRGLGSSCSPGSNQLWCRTQPDHISSYFAVPATCQDFFQLVCSHLSLYPTLAIGSKVLLVYWAACHLCICDTTAQLLWFHPDVSCRC